jgi:hypothetical protein
VKFKTNESNEDLRGTAAFLSPSFIAGVKNTTNNVEKILLGEDEIAPGEIYQVTDMASFLEADHVRKELMICLG